GLGVLGPERGMALANLLGIPVFMIVKTDDGFEERSSESFKPYLQKRL
ncbi:TPA: FAD:protein FMN transferase ApbE, partial [Yersinia enterocolitica]